jgi:hypothetical protein
MRNCFGKFKARTARAAAALAAALMIAGYAAPVRAAATGYDIAVLL